MDVSHRPMLNLFFDIWFHTKENIKPGITAERDGGKEGEEGEWGQRKEGYKSDVPLCFFFVQESRMCIEHFLKVFIYNSFLLKRVKENNHENFSEHNIQDNT